MNDYFIIMEIDNTSIEDLRAEILDYKNNVTVIKKMNLAWII